MMKGHSGYSITKNKFFENYKIASLITLLPWTYTLNLFFYMSMESLVQGLIVLPFTLALTPVFLGATSIGFVVNTAWGVVALPIAVIRNCRSPEHLEHEVKKQLEGNMHSFTKAQMMLSDNSVHDLVSGSAEDIDLSDSDDCMKSNSDTGQTHLNKHNQTFSALYAESCLELGSRSPG